MEEIKLVYSKNTILLAMSYSIRAAAHLNVSNASGRWRGARKATELPPLQVSVPGISRGLVGKHCMSEEIEVLLAIYPELVVSEDHSEGHIDINVSFDDTKEIRFSALRSCDVSYLPPLQLSFSLSAEYPDKAPPGLKLRCVWLQEGRLAALETACQDLWQEGEDALYAIFDHLYGMTATAFDTIQQDKDGKQVICLEDKFRDLIIAHHRRASQIEFEKKSYECGICLDWKAGDACVRLDCEHVFCKECLRDMFSLHIREGSVTSIRCPSCPAKEQKAMDKTEAGNASLGPSKTPLRLISIDVLQLVVSREEVTRYQKLLRKQELEALNSTHCPRTFCSTTLARDPDEKLVVCTECEYAFCADCMKGWHGPAEPCRRLFFSSSLGELYISLLADPEKVKDLKALERLYGVKNLQKLVRDLEDEKLADKWRRDNAQVRLFSLGRDQSS